MEKGRGYLDEGFVRMGLEGGAGGGRGLLGMAMICGLLMTATVEQLRLGQVPVRQSKVSSDFPLGFQPRCAVTCGQRRNSAEACDSQATKARQGPRT